jgi:hypothetical protein
VCLVGPRTDLGGFRFGKSQQYRVALPQCGSDGLLSRGCRPRYRSHGKGEVSRYACFKEAVVNGGWTSHREPTTEPLGSDSTHNRPVVA